MPPNLEVPAKPRLLRGTLTARIHGALAHPRAALGIAALALLLVSPALLVGTVMDDLVHALVLGGRGEPLGIDMTASDLFRFVSGDVEAGRARIARGDAPWFTDPALKIALLRPIAAALHRFDHALLGGSAVAMHAHSLLWFAAVVLAVGALHRRLERRAWVAGLATAFYALDDARSMPAAWIANRNALVATLFGVLSLLAHDRARRHGARAGAWLSPLLLGAALLSGELALGFAGYFVAYAAFVDDGPHSARLRAVAPHAAVLVGWGITYRALGYGASGSSLYLDPFAEPLRFAGVGLERALLLASSQLGLLSADFAPFATSAVGRVPVTLLGLAVLLLVIAAAWPLLRADRLARFWAAGAALALLPVAAAFPSDRLLMASAVGASALVARMVARLWPETGPHELGPFARVAAVVLLVVHGVLGPLQLPQRTMSVAMFGKVTDPGALPERAEGQPLVILVSPSLFGCTYLRIIELARGANAAPDIPCVAGSEQPTRVLREGPSTLLVAPEGGFAAPILDGLYWPGGRPFAPGDRVVTDAFTVEIVDLEPDGRPRSARFSFEGDLEARSWVVWGREGIVPFALPAVGAEVTVPGTSMIDLMLR